MIFRPVKDVDPSSRDEEWFNDGSKESHQLNQQTAVNAIEGRDPDLWFRMSAWAGRPGRVFGASPNPPPWKRVGRNKWERREEGPSRTTPEGNITPAKKENSREEWRKNMAAELRKMGVAAEQLERDIDEAWDIWGGGAPRVRCADESCALEQKADSGGTPHDPDEPYLVKGWDVSANAINPIEGVAGGLARLAEVAVCIRANFRCLPPLIPPPEYPRSSPLYFATKQDEFPDYKSWLEQWKKEHPFPYQQYNVAAPVGGAIEHSEPGCDCAGCECGRDLNPGMGSAGDRDVAWLESVSSYSQSAFWSAAAHFDARVRGTPTSSVEHAPPPPD